MDTTDGTRSVLRVLAHGRSNIHHICQQSGHSEAAADEALATLTDAGLAMEVDRGLYAITSAGIDALDRPYPDAAGFLRETSIVHTESRRKPTSSVVGGIRQPPTPIANNSSPTLPFQSQSL